MKINEIKIGDWLKFRYNDATKLGWLYEIIGGKYYLSEGTNIGGAQMWVAEGKDIVARVEYIPKETVIEHPKIPQSFTFEFRATAAQRNCNAHSWCESFMVGYSQWKEGSLTYHDREIRLPAPAHLDIAKRFKVTIEEILDEK